MGPGEEKTELGPPPAGAPWDLPVPEAPFAFVDLEMTGLDASADHVVEVCIERVRGGVCEARLATLVSPPFRSGGASHVHGLDEAALRGAPSFGAVADGVLALLDGAVLVAHAAAWDARFLGAELARHGKRLASGHFIDTLVLARRSFASPRYSLDALCKHLALDRGRAHRAEDDVRALRALFDRCVAELRPSSVRDLWEVRVAERRARGAILEACSAAIGGSRPLRITYRPSRRASEQLVFVVLRVASDLDPPRVLGYQLPGRGRRELRADRILRVDPD